MKKKHTPTTFHEWVKQTFTWVDNDLKRYMQRSWAASIKAANRRNKDNVKQLLAEKQELIDALDSVRYELQSENERMRELLVKRKNYIGEFPLFVQSLYSDELDEINNVLNPK